MLHALAVAATLHPAATAATSRRNALRTIDRVMGIALATLAVAGCASLRPARPVPVPVVEAEVSKSAAWLKVASLADRSRIDRVASAWTAGLAEARRGFRESMADEGKLLVPGAALPRPAPTPGSYRCRMITLGRDAHRGPAFEKFKPFFCYVGLEGDLFTIVKQTGSQRPAGRLWEDDAATRLIFLGSLALGSEEEARAYGDDPKRDVAGVFERIGPVRWRLLIPFPQDGAKLDVIELTPVADQPAS